MPSEGPTAAALLEQLHVASAITEGGRYVEAIAGILRVVLKMKDDLAEGKEEWSKVIHGMGKVRKLVVAFRGAEDDPRLPLPAHAQAAFDALERSLEMIFLKMKDYQELSKVKRFLLKSELKANAIECAEEAKRAIKVMEVEVRVKESAHERWHLESAAAVGIQTTATSSRLLGLACAEPSAYFVGRGRFIFGLARSLRGPERRVVTITGAPGSGKTQTVLKFVSEYASQYSRIFLLSASSFDRLNKTFGTIARASKVGCDTDAALLWLRSLNENWLLILDNADEGNFDVGQFIPKCGHGLILIVGTSTNIEQYASTPDDALTLPELDKKGAVAIFLSHAGLPLEDENIARAAAIVTELGKLPLAVAMAGAYIASFSHDLAEFLFLLKMRRSGFIRRRLKKVDTSKQPRGVLSAFKLSFWKLPPHVRLFLQFCGFMHPAGVPVEVFRYAASNMVDDYLLPGEGPPVSGIRRTLLSLLAPYQDVQTGLWDGLKFHEMLGLLERFAFLAYNRETKTCTVHSVVHAAVRDTIADRAGMQAAVLQLLARATPPEDDEVPSRMRRLRMLAHVERAWNREYATAYVCTALVRVFEDGEVFERAKDVRRDIVARLDKFLGNRHVESMGSQADLSAAYFRLGRAQRAKRVAKDVLTRQRSLVIPGDEGMLRSMGVLAASYAALGQWKHAEMQEVEVLEMSREASGADHPRTMSSSARLVVIHTKTRRLEKARRLSIDVVARRKRVLGKRHPDTLAAMNDLAKLYLALGRVAEGKKLTRRLLVLRMQLFGERHPTTMEAMANLTAICVMAGEWEDANMLGTEVLQRRRELLGNTHLETVASMVDLASAEGGLKKWVEAEELLAEAVAVRKAELGEAHADTLAAMALLAWTFAGLERWDAAKALLYTVLDARRQTLGDEHPDTVHALNSLSDLDKKEHPPSPGTNSFHSALGPALHTIEEEGPAEDDDIGIVEELVESQSEREPGSDSDDTERPLIPHSPSASFLSVF